MTSRLGVRTVLVVIMSLLVWALWWTWTAERFDNKIGPRIFLTIIEGGAMIAALSLLFESFLSFGDISVKKGTWKYFFFGHFLIDENKATSATLHTCTLFYIRSFALAMSSLIGAMLLVVLYQVAKAVVSLILEPRIPNLDWAYALYITLAIVVMYLMVAGTISLFGLVGKISNLYVQVLAGVFLLSVVFSVMLSGIFILDLGSNRGNLSIWDMILMGMSIFWAVLIICSLIAGLGYLIYKGAQRVVGRFPTLASVWNQLCPVQTVHFIR